MASAQLLSPGALSRAHAEIDGDDNCNECHASGRRVEESRCFRCHDDLRRRMGRGLGLHGREYRGRNCVSCHVEHLGRGTALVRWPGGAPERLDHGDTGWPLRGAHLSTGCRDCHDNRNRRGNRTYLGQSGACASCHDDDDPHDGRFGQQCNTCHGEQSWRNVRMSEFDHSLARFALRGEHQSVACRACHGEPPRYRGVAFDTCASCHDDPHGGRYGPRCASCHNETGWDDLGDVRNNHPGLSLRNGHARVACGRCHDRGVDVAPSQGRACASCHRPVHEAEFGRNCAQCHRSIKWVGIPERIGRAAHARTAFPLEGRHERVDCQGCHRRELSLEARYRELTFDQCDGCHQDRHSGELADLEGGGECESCHTVRGFAPSLFGVSAHASTGFALDGRHAAVPCSGCHQHDGRPRLSWSGAQEECASCHDNPHGDQFADEMTRGGCASCHSPAGWDRPNIDHSIWPLTGAHELATCNACHTPSAEDRGLGRGASYRGVARECGGCHDDVHAGQFRLTDPQKTCETCHSTVAFRIRRFDHVANADYALEGRHAEAECASCHPTISLRNDAEVVRYRLGYRECNDCHASPHEDPER
jgi:hypothetical protein